ncbi:hypothetical protein WME97_33745 [Sorangium sp. So ce367]|uniref:hypothetical protein n=1 Tax=Sorangium sp. So ce367 TaxID=3133305 RepID=UPI003F5FBBFF
MQAVIDVAAMPGTDAGEKIKNAIDELPSPGGGVLDATGLTGDQFIHETLLINKPVKLILGAAAYKYDSGVVGPTAVFKIGRNFVLEGAGRDLTRMEMLSSGVIFKFLDTWPYDRGKLQFSVEFVELLGNGLKASVLDSLLPKASPGEHVGFNEGLIRIEHNRIRDFLATAIMIGRSKQIFKIRQNHFSNNRGSVFTDDNADGLIEANEFVSRDEQDASAPGAEHQPQVEVMGPNVRVVGNKFTKSPSTVSTRPDLVIAPAKSNSVGGFLWVAENRFSSTRVAPAAELPA